MAESMDTKSRIHFNGPYVYMEPKMNDVLQELKKHRCSSSLTAQTTPMDALIHCQYVASWTDPVEQRTVTVVRGNSWNIPFDLHVVFTNEQLQPLDTQDGGTAANAFCKEVRRVRSGVLKVGEMTNLVRKSDKLLSTFTGGLVIQTTTKETPSIREEDMKNGIERMLQLVSTSVDTVGISATAGAKNIDLVTNILDLYETFNNSKVQTLFICCLTEVSALTEKVGNYFRNKRGVLRRVYTTNQNLGEMDPQTKVSLLKMPIEKVEVDVIVNTTNRRLDLTLGKVSKALSQAVGDVLQSNLKKVYPKGLLKEEVAHLSLSRQVSQDRHLPFKDVLHIALSCYQPTLFNKELRTYVQKCMCIADRLGYKSIAFPALGKSYPSRETVTVMYEAANEYIEEVIDSNLQNVIFVIHPQDLQTFKVFEDEHWRWSRHCEKDVGVSRHFVKTEFMAFRKEFSNRLMVTVATVAEFGLPPPFAIQIEFGKCQGLKSASSEPKRWNTRYVCSDIKTKEELKKFQKEIIELSSSERATMLVIYPSIVSSVTVAEQIQKIMTAMESSKQPFLSEVVFIVPDDSYLNNADHFLKGAQRKKVIKGSKTNVYINIGGQTREQVMEAEKCVKELAQKAEKDIEKRVCNQSCYASTDMTLTKMTNQTSDEDAFEVLDDETLRRTLSCEKGAGDVGNSVKSDLMAFQKKFNNGLLVRVSTLVEFGLPPPTALLIVFGNGPEGLRPTSSEPKQWDVRHFSGEINKTEDLKKCQKKIIELSDSKRTTMLVIYPSPGQAVTVEKQIESIMHAVASSKPTLLDELIFVVPDDSAWQNVDSFPKGAKKTKLASSSKTNVDVDVVGQTRKQVMEGDKYAQGFMKNSEKDIEGQMSNQSCCASANPTVNQETDKKIEEETFEDSSVSAELNTGIIQFLESSKKLQTWITEMETAFKIKAHTTKDCTVITVHGKLKNILDVENYLETRFPEDPADVASSVNSKK